MSTEQNDKIARRAAALKRAEPVVLEIIKEYREEIAAYREELASFRKQIASLGSELAERPPEDGPTAIPYQDIMAWWNYLASEHDLPKCLALNSSRKKHMRQRWKEWSRHDSGEGKVLSPHGILAKIADGIKHSRFLRGETTSWKVSFDWIISGPDNWLKVLEGKYADQTSSRGSRFEG